MRNKQIVHYRFGLQILIFDLGWIANPAKRVPQPIRVLKGRPERKRAVQPLRKTVETICTPSLHTNPPILIIIGENPKESRELFCSREAGWERPAASPTRLR